MESLINASLLNDGGKQGPVKGPIIEQDIFDQEELQALRAANIPINYASPEIRASMGIA